MPKYEKNTSLNIQRECSDVSTIPDPASGIPKTSNVLEANSRRDKVEEKYPKKD